ncbi:hypothetical protein SDC9_180065 [bioreactor metagenome]|uniref:Uncharacterized protein n=1 Tax=bioreactor metagenome TaxID=1076179 RepID=A0A645H0L2_9ZZZZ
MDNGNGSSGLPHPAGTAAAMRVNFVIIGQTEVNNVRDIVHIQAPGSNIGSNQQLQIPQAELVHHIITLRLRQITV